MKIQQGSAFFQKVKVCAKKHAWDQGYWMGNGTYIAKRTSAMAHRVQVNRLPEKGDSFEVGTVDVTGEVLQQYHVIDHKIRVFRIRSGLRCPPLCGICCDSPHVEASILECLPLAWEIFRRGKEELVSLSIEEKQGGGDLRCILFLKDEEKAGLGRCTYYPFRPLVCRLFGYAARRDKSGRPELQTCKLIRERSPKSPLLSNCMDIHPTDAPIYQDSFLQIASMNPAMGFRLFPINIAIKAALDYLYWQRPKGRFRMRRRAA